MQWIRRPGLRTAPLTAAVVAIIAATAQATQASPGNTAMTRPGAIELRNQLLAQMPSQRSAPTVPTTTWPVTSCADSDKTSTLRGAVAAAGEGDTVDLSHLRCSAITLSHGAIPVLLNNLNITGPGADALRIDGAGKDRVFLHPGSGALILQGLTVRNGAARASGFHITGGGCIASAGYVVLDHSVVRDCYASAEGVYGAGVFAYELLMYTSTLSRNIGRAANSSTGTATFGGGAYVNTMYLVDSTVSGNQATHDLNDGQTSYDTGGGIFSNTGGYVVASTISGNYSYGFGGGIAAFGGYTGVINSTISGNIARTRSGGGLDLRVFYGGLLANTTITANQAPTGGGVYLRGAPRTFTLLSTLLAGNSAAGAGPDLGAVFAVTVAGVNNLVVAADGSITLPNDTLHANPKLQPLADNGGPTRTHALSPDSPALDAGNDLAGLANDQRGAGFPRIVGAATDIGAFEGFVVPRAAPVNVPVASTGVLAAFGALLAVFGAARLRQRRPSRPFTWLSPDWRHSSHR
ncbi:MAG TPA: choice-of-anchor Q domain-containing protein [Rudaea sp.]|jgi:hypothetical protein